ncbi:hypothetical protein [Actinomycetospora termitidis]|uniref:Knr4/Smi1-like domain-containing protein n=1 Tax=Actinomycetospora termitidis TaxID=3053470 RepID=A0ABT7M104_9PSEU|nr:hypothetical protein [Actinomycetospora sp. Odt1-22]MDL5154342.1 hypothetical protein [Actinomycetospora sp. Odt1-22]
MTNGRQPLSDRPRGSARGGVPDDELRAAWARWLGVLRNRGRDPVPVLRPGAAPSALAVAEQTVGFALPDPVRALYAVNDGQEGPGGPAIFPAHEFCSLVHGARVAGEHGPEHWPLAEDAAGHHLLVDCTSGRVVTADRELAPGLLAYLGLLAEADLDLADDGSWDAPALR